MDTVVIHNPAAGRAAARLRQFRESIDVLKNEGWTVHVRETSGEGHASELAANAAKEGADIVVAAGGDGTVNEVVQGLVHTRTALGVLPTGTVNVWSREAGYSSKLVNAARQLVVSHKRSVDLGRVGNRFFLLMAGIGLDAEVTAALGTAKMQKQKLGVLPYVVRLSSILPRYRGASIEIEMDGQVNRHDALMVLISNTRLYGGISRPNRHAVANDGMLDVRVFHGTGPTHSVRHIARLLLEHGSATASCDVIRAKKIAVTATPPLAVQVDGDPIGMTPVEIEVAHHALRVMVPEAYDSALISPDHE